MKQTDFSGKESFIMNDEIEVCAGPPVKNGGDFRGSSCCGCLRVAYPGQEETIYKLSFGAGQAHACASVSLWTDGQMIAQTKADCCGRWQVGLSVTLAAGAHTLRAVSRGEEVLIKYYIEDSGEAPIPSAPVITEPSGRIMERSPVIEGYAQPGITVHICMDGGNCRDITAAEDGTFSMKYPGSLDEGRHLVTAEAVNKQGVRSDTAFQIFDYEEPEEFSVILLGAQEGGGFRTIRLALSAASPIYPVTLSYLLLPPGTPAPSVQEIESYNGQELLTGMAARGSVTLDAGGRQNVDISGREHAPAGALGVVDGYRYDVYLFARAGEFQTPVMAEAGIMGMAFGGGHGVEGDPYLIHQLTASDLASYPDLSADKSPLGVDDTARMLRNIENMRTLSMKTEGRYGLYDSMSLCYQLTGPIDLAGYGAADGGNGWPALGCQGEEESVCPFTGVLRGRGTETPVCGLTVISSHARRYVGLFATGKDMVFQNLALESARIHMEESPDDEIRTMDIGVLCATTEGGIIEDVTLTDITVTRAGNSVYTVIGGLTAQGDGGMKVRSLSAERVHMVISDGAAGCLFGTAYAAGSKGMCAENIRIRDCSVRSEAFPAGLFGGRIYGPKCLKDITARDCEISGSGVMGLIGHCHTTLEHCIIERLKSERLRISAAGEGSYYIGGVFGYLLGLGGLRIRDCAAEGCEIHGSQSVGGFIGYFRMHGALQVQRCYVTNVILEGAEKECGGFIGSIRLYERPQESQIFSNCKAELAGTVLCGSFAGGFVGHCYKTRDMEEKVLFYQCMSRGEIQCIDKFCGGFTGSCDMGTYIQCHSDCRVSAPSLVGGFAGDCSAIVLPDEPNGYHHLTFNRCSAAGMVHQEGQADSYGFAGGFAGRARGVHIEESYSSAMVRAEAADAGAFLGSAGNDTVVRDCYASGDVEQAGDGAGGIFGVASVSDGTSQSPQTKEITVLRCYYQGSLYQSGAGTGGIGGRCDTEGGVTIKDCLVLSPVISGKAPTRRVAGERNAATILTGNYATTVQVLEDNIPRLPGDDPDGRDGGTIITGEIKQWMAAAGWSKDVWDYTSVTKTSGPVLLNNPPDRNGVKKQIH